MSPHTPEAASALLGLAQDYAEACHESNEFAASEAARGMIESLQSRHVHTHLRLCRLPVDHARRSYNGHPTALVALPLSVYEKLVKPLLDLLESGEEPEYQNDLPSFAERIWPRATRN